MGPVVACVHACGWVGSSVCGWIAPWAEHTAVWLRDGLGFGPALVHSLSIPGKFVLPEPLQERRPLQVDTARLVATTTNLFLRLSGHVCLEAHLGLGGA